MKVENDRYVPFNGIHGKFGRITLSKRTIKHSHFIFAYLIDERGTVLFIAMFYEFHDMLRVLHLATSRSSSCTLSPEILWKALCLDLICRYSIH